MQNPCSSFLSPELRNICSEQFAGRVSQRSVIVRLGAVRWTLRAVQRELGIRLRLALYIRRAILSQQRAPKGLRDLARRVNAGIIRVAGCPEGAW